MGGGDGGLHVPKGTHTVDGECALPTRQFQRVHVPHPPMSLSILLAAPPCTLPCNHPTTPLHVTSTIPFTHPIYQSIHPFSLQKFGLLPEGFTPTLENGNATQPSLDRTSLLFFLSFFVFCMHMHRRDTRASCT